MPAIIKPVKIYDQTTVICELSDVPSYYAVFTKDISGFTDHVEDIFPETMCGYLEYLDALRESGETNMYLAAPYLVRQFPEIHEPTSHAVLIYWMQTFSNRHPKNLPR